MDQEEIEKVVLAYLDKRGFKQAGPAFQQEKHQSSNTFSTVQIDVDTGNQILSFPEVGGPTLLQERYNNLRSWAYSSLEQYQYELVRILYPVFIYVFMNLVAKGHIQEARAFFDNFRGDHEMIHSRDLQKFEGVLSPSHLEEMEFAHSLRQSKVRIKICQYSYDLLLQYLNKPQSIYMLGIINENIIFQVSDAVEFVMLYGSGQDKTKSINQREIHWELLEDSLEGKLEKTRVSNMDSEKDGELGEGELEENKNRVQLSRVALPSISFYTLINSQDGLNCASISHDGSLLAGGFSDSSLKVWDMEKLGQQNGCFPFQDGNELAPNEHIPSTNSEERSYTLFRGHAGPVILPLLVHLEIFSYLHRQIQQFDCGTRNSVQTLFATKVTITLSGMFSLVL